MDVTEFIRNSGQKTIPNPYYNPRSKKNTQPPTIIVPDIASPRDQVLDMAREDALNREVVSAKEADKYREYGLNWNRREAESGELDVQLADAQSNWNKAWHAVTQTVVSEGALGIARGFSDLIDFVVGGAIRTVTGEENDYTNPVSETIKGWQEAFNEYQPIHVTPGVDILHGGFANFGWWMSNMPSIISSLSLLVPSGMATKGISLLGKATRLNKGIGNVRKFLTNINKYDKAANSGEKLETIGKVSQWINNENTVRKANEMFEMGVNGFTSRIMENYQESNQVYQDLLPEIYNGDANAGVKGIKDMSDEEYANLLNRNADILQGVDTNYRSEVAKRIAKEAADTTFRIDMINGFFDVYELYGLRNIKHFMNGPMRASLRRKHLNSIKYPGKTKDEIEAILKGRSFGAKAVEKVSDALYGSRRALASQLSEGVEEAINYIAQEEGLTYGHVLLGTESESNFWDTRLIQYAKNPQLYESAFWGVLGGVVFQAGGSGLVRAKNAYNVKRKEAKYKPDDKTQEAIKKTPWSEAFEMPEMQARIGNVEARAKAEDLLRNQLAQIKDKINPFDKNPDGSHIILETEEERAVARDRAFNMRERSLLMDAMFVGNWDITRAYLESNEVRDALVEAGVISKEEAIRRQAEAKQMADKMEELYSRNLRAVGNAMRGKDDATGADYSSIPTEYFQIIAAENMNHQIDAEQYDRNIAQYAPVIGSEEERLKDELAKNGMNYKESIRSFVLAQQLGQINAELEAAKKTLKQGRSKNNIDARTISGQTAIRELELRKRVLESLISSINPLNITDNNKSDKETIKRAKHINEIANKLVNYRAVAATETTEEGGYQMNINSERYRKLDSSIVKAFNAKTDEDWKSAIGELSQVDKFFETQSRDDFREAAHLADVFNENVGIALGQDGTIKTLDKLSHTLLTSYATVTYNEIAREIELAQIANDRDSIRTIAHNKHNDMQSMRGVTLESALYALKGIAKNYSEEFGDISDILAYGTLNSNARNRLKEILSEEDMRTYDDVMRIIALNRKSVTGSGKDTSAINTLLPEMVKDALYRSSQDEFEEVKDETTTEDTTEEDTKTGENSSVSQNASQSEQKAGTTKSSTKEEKADTSDERGQIVDFHIRKSGNKNEIPVASISVNSDGAPTKLNQYAGNHKDYTDAILIQSKEDDHEYELDFKRELDTNGKDGTEEVFNNPHFFNVKTPIINGGKVISNPRVVVDDDGTVLDYMPGVIDNPESVEGQEEQAKEDESKKEGGNDASPLPTGGLSEIKSDKEVDPAIFEDYDKQHPDEARAAETPYEVDNLYDDLMPLMVGFAQRRQAAGEDYDENVLLDELKEQYKGTVSEEDLTYVFNKVKNFGRKAAKNLKLNIQEYNDLANFVYQSSLSDADLGVDEKAKARKELEKTFDSILENYAKRTIADTYKGKKVISLENLLRYANEVAGDSRMGELLYEKFVELLKQKDDYFIVEKIPNRSAIIQGASMTSEERFDTENSPNGRSLDLNSLLRNATNEQKEKIYDIIDGLKPGDEIQYQTVNYGKKIEFMVNDVSLGTINVPHTTATSYETITKGWIADVPKSNDGSRSRLEQLFIRLMINPDNEEKIKPIIEAIQKPLYISKTILDKELNKRVPNQEYEKACENIIKLIKDAGIDIEGYINLSQPYYNDFTLGDYMVSIYRYVKSASEQWLNSVGLTVEEYNDAIKNLRVQSIHNWFERLKDSYTTAMQLVGDPMHKLRVDTIFQGGLITTSRDKAEPVNAEGVIGSNHKGKLDIAVASISEIGKVYFSDGTTKQMSAIKGGSTFVTIPRSTGDPALVHAFPVSIGASHLKGEVKEIHDEVIKEFDRLLSEWSDNVNMSCNKIADFINTLCSSSNKNSPLLKGFRVTKLTGGFQGIQIEYNSDGRKKYIKLFDAHPTGGKASVIQLSGEKPTAFKEKNRRANVIEAFNKVLDEALTFNIAFDYVQNTSTLKGFAKRGTKGQFIVQIPNGKEHTFTSFKDFVIDNGVVAVTTKSTNGKTNFYRIGESYNQFDKPRVTYKVLDNSTTPVERVDATQPEEPTVTVTKKGDSIKTLIENNPNSSTIGEEIINSILNGTQLNVLKNSRIFKELSLGNIIFVNKISGAIAGHFKKDKLIDGVTIPAGTIAVTQKWIDLLNSEDSARHEEAVRHLIHESIHRKIDSLSEVEQRKLFDTIRGIFNEFVAANERDGVRQEFAPYEYNTNKTSERLYYKNGELNDRGLEEFLVETITRPALIKRLNEIATDGNTISKRTVGNVRSKNLFQKILAVIAKLFDLNINKGSLLEKEYKLFEQIGLSSTQQEQKTDTKVKPKASTTKNAVQLELKFDETDNNNETVTTIPQESSQQPQIATDINNITVEGAQMMEVDDDDIDESAISDEEINATETPEVASVGQVRDTIIPENRETFERLVSKGAIQINC